MLLLLLLLLRCLLDQQLKRMAPVKQVEHDEYKEEFEKEEYGDEITDIEIIPHVKLFRIFSKM